MAAPLAGSQAPSSEEFFEDNIRPLLIEKCLDCHGEGGRRPKGNLRLDTRMGWQRGGDLGPAILAGRPDESLLMRAVGYEDPDLQMPPDGKLAPHEIAALREWIKAGAYDPREEVGQDLAEALPVGAEHWAFQPMRTSAPPAVQDNGWSSNAIDAFIWHNLELQGLAPAPPADPATLMRRLTYDLIGLPPSPEEVAAFVADPSPLAYAELVERLLASPHYGERYARHWLDLARYADSNGLDENLALGNAWRYRDWVVRAFQQDLPYDRFIAMQLAGDLLPEPAPQAELYDRWTATGFLVLGAKMLAEQDKEKLVMDIVDEQLDVAGKAILGLSLGCARCHDHKFDPIPTRDYYALAGIFKSTSTMAHLEHVSRWRERPLATALELRAVEEHKAAVAASQARVEELERSAEALLAPAWRRQFSAYLLAATQAAREVVFLEAEDFSRSNLQVDADHWGSPHCTIVHSQSDGTQYLEWDLSLPRGGFWQVELRYASDEVRPLRLLVDHELRAEELAQGDSGSYFSDGQHWERLGGFEFRPGRNVLRLERLAGPFPHIDKLLLIPLGFGHERVDWPAAHAAQYGLTPEIVRNTADFLVRSERLAEPYFAAWRAFAAIPEAEFAEHATLLFAEMRQAHASGAATLPSPLGALFDGLAPQSLADWAGRYQTIVSLIEEEWTQALALSSQDAAPPALLDPNKEALRTLLHGPAGPFNVPKALAQALYPQASRKELEEARRDVERLRLAAPEALAHVLCVSDEAQPEDLAVHVRGSHLTLAKERTPRGALSLCDGLVPALRAPPDHSGRLELVRWLCHPEHPLVARVMVNRLWQWHFGEGLVRSPSNFGLRGEKPSHPELLDWLAREFVRSGYSIKAMHRIIVHSATYRMSTTYNAQAAALDPLNRWLWRMHRRRLEAECVRDAFLVVGGTLESTLGGTLLATGNGDYVTNDQSADQAGYDLPRRSLYLPVIRNAQFDFFALFDCPDPSVPLEQRACTTVASQALYLMNSPLAIHASEQLASRVRQACTADADRIVYAWRLCFAREPAASELDALLAYLASERERLGAIPGIPEAGAAQPAPAEELEQELWQRLAQILLASNEFVYLD